MEISIKDILEDNGAKSCLCDCIAEKLVEKGLFETTPLYDDFGSQCGFDECIKPELENLIRKQARDVCVEEAKKLLKDDYEIKKAIRDTIRNYIIEQFEKMVSNANK